MLKSTVFKVILVGEGGVGKTSIVVKYTEDRFEEDMKMTIGVNFATKKVDVSGQGLTLMLWDLGGQPRFFDVVSDYFKGSKFAIAVYDSTRAYTLERLADWIERVRSASPDCDLLIVGNKIDERDSDSGVSYEDGIAFASKYGVDCIEVSAKTGEGINEMFDTVATRLSEKYL